MFDTLDEAVEMNSECAFCKKPKFIPFPHFVDATLTTQNYTLERCSYPDCSEHCRWDHANEQIKITDDREAKDILSIASGWGAR